MSAPPIASANPAAPPAASALAPLRGDIWRPRSRAQRAALDCPAQILLFGGAAGSLKSETLLLDALREYDNPNLRAILFRRSYPELERTLIRRSRDLFPHFGGAYNESKKRWTFKSGGLIEFGYLESENDVHRYQGAEFSFIGFDESTHFTEFSIRYMLSRLRSTDPSLQLRMRLASNPGNIGHNTHKAIFQGPTCTHCQNGKWNASTRRPGVLYNDAVWPSDKRAIGRSTCFIPGRVVDHELLGADYVRNLESMPGAFRKALLEGCWDVYEGQYFDIWSPERMSVNRARIPVAPWWPHWVGIDYGFQGSQAVAYLLCRSPATSEFPNGQTFVLEEYCVRHQKADDFGAEIRRRFVDEAGRHISAWYLSPDAWSDRGEGHSLADQMTAAARVGFESASNDRIGGAMLIYSQLDRGELVIAQGCSQLLEAIPTRIHDPARPDDILKISGDPFDDCIDALRYAVYSFIGPARRPAAFDIAAAATSSDPTIAALQRRAAEHRIFTAAQPHYYLRRRYR